MGRPALRIGAHGSISTRETSPGKWQARCRYRDTDGVTRPVSRWGTSKSNAIAELQDALKQRRPAGHGDVAATTRVHALATTWIGLVDQDDSRRQGTKVRYRWLTEKVVVPAIGALQVQECTPGRVSDFLQAVLVERGHSTAKTTRVCLSMMLGYAVRQGALDANPVRDAEKLTGKKKPPPRTLTRDEERRLMVKLRKDKLAREHDLIDLVVFMLGTGCRIGEATALYTSEVDLDAGTVEVLATMTDYGRQEEPKTSAGHRVIAVPPHVVALLRRRIEDPRIYTDVACFPSPLGKLRDTSNTSAHLRRAFDRAGFEWVHSHTFRKTVATRLDEASLSAREIADHLGHKQVSMTTDVYMGRKVASQRPAEALTPPAA